MFTGEKTCQMQCCKAFSTPTSLHCGRSISSKQCSTHFKIQTQISKFQYCFVKFEWLSLIRNGDSHETIIHLNIFALLHSCWTNWFFFFVSLFVRTNILFVWTTTTATAMRTMLWQQKADIIFTLLFALGHYSIWYFALIPWITFRQDLLWFQKKNKIKTACIPLALASKYSIHCMNFAMKIFT